MDTIRCTYLMFLGKELEVALLGNVARLAEALDRLLAGGMGLSGNDATLVHHEVVLLETARRVVGRAVHDLDARSDGHVRTARLTATHAALTHGGVLTSRPVLAVHGAHIC